jgi:hypothetical protein
VTAGFPARASITLVPTLPVAPVITIRVLDSFELE